MAENTSTVSNNSIINSANQATSTKTARGTRIVKPGQEMDKNAFLRILSAELSNQNPENAKDGTEYVAQMAQFAGLEQMANLNSSMRLTGANSLMDKYITLAKLDENGSLYNGKVQSITKSGSDIKLSVVVGKEKDKEGNLVDKIQDFNLEDVSQINNVNLAGTAYDNSAFVNAAYLVGKKVQLNQQDTNKNNYTGIVTEISRDAEGIKVKVQTGENETRDFPVDEIIKVTQS
ncbi:flagellar hook assembly protein FlgD [Clostridium sp. DJ247]|uniref:flagellar hook assembly protein FlgD n=1 Tax=Clostridium sp. DJ247 TaxID=2726188 RepID=UPI00162858AA|nr:flagellar hook capping FlgD N-terminal domain-containing protein [Clostridium sp. DJ247]MBC2582132.1 flagellar hook capping protein [Clostridium sp. DJ247]